MPVRQLTGNCKRKNGTQWWVVYCPRCKKNHWMEAGPYTVDPRKDVHRTLPCGSRIEIIPDAASLKRIKKQFK